MAKFTDHLSHVGGKCSIFYGFYDPVRVPTIPCAYPVLVLVTQRSALARLAELWSHF